ncbi:GumC family protein [Eudoraea adriatica]|uniref:GumC family protein n=1 Tax=Eudoraea adriatica TaxID=446681 RepID=UPI00037F41D9|nr:tyrosine-protein kinase [Eudoraea adriatica]
MESNYSSFSDDNKLDFKELIRPYLRHWKWFVFSLVFAIALSLFYFRYATPLFEVEAKIQILADDANSNLSTFSDLQKLTGGKNASIVDEIEILASRSNIVEVVKELGLNISVIAKGDIKKAVVYEKPPFKINFLVPDSLIYLAKSTFQIEVLSETSFSFKEEEDLSAKNYSFGNTINSSVGEFVLLPNAAQMTHYAGNEYEIWITPIQNVVQTYQEKIEILLLEEGSNIVSISLMDAVEKRALDIVNMLIYIYNRNAVQDKKEMADKTSEFINERITDIYGDLSTVDQSAEDFKEGRGITDVESQSNINLNIGAANRQELQNKTIQLNIAASMKDIVDNQNGYEVLPSNIGLDDESIANTTARYNELVLERNRLLKSSNEKNPIIVNLDQQLRGLRRNLQSSLSSMTNNLNLQVNNLSSQVSSINAKIYAAPGNERALRDITRQQQTTEALYLYLLQKREESQITFASAAPKSKVIDHAYPISPFPVAPKKPIILLASMIFGLLLPFSFIYFNQLLDNKVHNKVDLEKQVDPIPVFAELPKLSKKENSLVRSGERTVLAESLRILRTNLDYVIKSKKKSSKGNIVLITSSVPGEGKTFISSNLAMIFANTNKKVLLIGADIRNPKIYQFYSGKNIDKLGKAYRNKENKGLTEYLVDPNLGYKDIISSMLVYEQTIDIIYSGKIPPNPADLLMSDRMSELLEAVKLDYDYIFVDSAPLMVVSDTLLISELADQIIYVTRAGVTELKVLDFPLKLYKEGKLKGLSFIVNDVKSSNLGYGGRYGYGYGKSVKKWWNI